MPFLYLPDSLSLALLLPLFGMLRRSAVAHLHQELLRIRQDMFFFWFDQKLTFSHPAYIHLGRRIDSASRLAVKLSPARLFFIFRLCKGLIQTDGREPGEARASQLAHQLEGIDNRYAREKLLRAHLEINFSIGLFFLMGSISGLVLFAVVLFHLLRRAMRGASKERVDRLFDLAEKLFARVGYRVQKLALLVDSGT